MFSTKVCTSIELLLLLALGCEVTVTQDVRSFGMFIKFDRRFSCENTTCSPFANMTLPSLRDCQLACLADSDCRAASFRNSSSRCELFDITQNETDDLEEQSNAVAMIVMDSSRFLSAESNSMTTTTTTVSPYPPCNMNFCCTQGPSALCSLYGSTCNCTGAAGVSGAFYCGQCRGRGPPDYWGNGTCYYTGHYYGACPSG